MAIKTVETVRKIRDENYQTTKDLSVEEQIKLINQKAKKLRARFQQDKKESA